MEDRFSTAKSASVVDWLSDGARALRDLSLFLVHEASQLLRYLLIFLIICYQRLVSPLLRPSCRFLPSCSEYGKECLHKYGVMKGLSKTVWRLLRCHPLGKGGLDLP